MEQTFVGLPDTDAAVRLLSQIASPPCPFSPVPIDRPLALYGGGNLGRLARDHLHAVGHEFLMVIDRDAHKLTDSADWAGMTVRHPDDVGGADRGRLRVAVSVVTAPYVPIEQALMRHGFTDVVPFYDIAESFRQLHPLSNGWFAAPLSAHDRACTAQVLAGWADDQSRAYHLQFLAWRRLREEWIFAHAPVSTTDRFFIPEVVAVLNNREVLVDGGAHFGTVAHDFSRLTDRAYDRIIAFEPDRSNRAELEKSASAGDSRFAIYDCALAENDGRAKFHDGLGYASQISSTGRLDVATRALDALGLSPTYIKLHIEGGELNALKGAKETLLSHRPIVAATVYHNADGIWRTPLWLMQTLPQYCFLFRNHGWCGTGAVVYAIPHERF